MTVIRKTYNARWMRHFRAHAQAARDKVKEPTHVGAVLIGHNNEVLLTAFNGPPIRVKDTGARRSRKDGLKYKFSAHAERNLIAFAAKHGLATRGLTVYTTHHPCSACAAELVQAGIDCVIVGPHEFKSAGDEVKHAWDILNEAGVQMLKDDVSQQELRAETLARLALLDKVDANGDSKFYHTTRVVDSLPYNAPISTRILAWLHDVPEDWDVMEDDAFHVIAAMFGMEIVDDLKYLTIKLGENYDRYIERLISSDRPDVLLVKLADNLDNEDPARRVDLTEEDIKKFSERYAGLRDRLLDKVRSSRDIQKWLDRHQIWPNISLFSRNPYQ